MLHKNRFELDLETCCIGDLCTLNRNGVPWPIIYGVGVNVKTGDIFPAQFNEKGPDMDLRYARTLTGGDNVGVSYFFSIHHFKINIQSWPFAFRRLLNNPYVNEVYLTGQNLT